MEDPTLELRRQREEINAHPRSRDELEADYGSVWNSVEMGREFRVELFLAPLVIVRRKRDRAKGSLLFQHSPRFYFRFLRDDTL
jgi:hypothetical protein